MITPRATRVVRVPSLRALQRTVAVLGLFRDPWSVRDSAVLVPTSSAADELRRTLEQLVLVEAWQPPPAYQALRAAADRLLPGPWEVFVPPLCVTREELWDVLHARYGPLPQRLNDFEREALLAAAVATALDAGVAPPFTIRPGLIAEMLSLYDALRRRYRSIGQLQQHAGSALAAGAEFDRGAGRLMRQTDFLVAVFTEYEARVAASGRLDEHSLRERLLVAESRTPIRRLIVTVGDQAADPFGLWQSDFDLMTRLRGLEHIDIVATDAMLDAGLLERLLDTLPDAEVIKLTSDDSSRPRIVVPSSVDGARHYVLRDREEEMAHVVRWLVSGPGRSASNERAVADQTAVVFQRPLPYLYLGRTVFESARIPFQALDALPLASEPFAAAFDLLTSLPLLDWTRLALVSLLGSPHFSFDGRGPLPAIDVAAFDRALAEAEYLGGYDRLFNVLDRLEGRALSAEPYESVRARVCGAVRALLTALRPLVRSAPTVDHVDALADVLDRFACPLPEDNPLAEREARARRAVRGVLEAMRAAHERYGDRAVPFRDVVMALRRWIGSHTFGPRTGGSGVHLVDAQAARFGNFENLVLVGLVEGEWQASSPRNIFYPSSILANLGWPAERHRQEAARAAFSDLLELAKSRVMVTTFTLEDDAIVEPSTLLEEVPEHGRYEIVDVPHGCVFVEDALTMDPVMPDAVTGEARAWLDARMIAESKECVVGLACRSEPRAEDDGSASRLESTHAVTRLETYLRCPFRYFAAHVLRLEEELRDDIGLSPAVRGIVLHEVFEEFFTRWGRQHRGAIEVSTLDDARRLMAEVVEGALSQIPAEDREIERARLMGSPTTMGFAEQVFRAEVERGGVVLERLLEHRLDGKYPLESRDVRRLVALRGVADRIDVMEDGALCVYDYKSGRAPVPKARLQLPVYAWCVEQQFAGRRGQAWRVQEAAYLAARESDGVVMAFNTAERRDQAMGEGLERLANVVAGLERRAYPVAPVDPRSCAYCPYPTVCRKDDLGDD